ncbi:MAG TPA: hypothetical protein VEX68_30290 [Bryobacteraceae bacterium]|nr:hypothetical protein [Bryobacteraceae bacterium]
MEIRYQPDQPVRLNVLGGISPRAMAASMIHLSGRHAELRVAEVIAADAAVKIELDDSMLLGEVLACSPRDGAYVAGIRVVEAIPSMSNLARLVAAVMNESRSESRVQPAAPVTVA